MPELIPNSGAFVSIAKDDLQQVLQALKDMGYTLIGPKWVDGAIVNEEIDGLDDLPVGWADEQGPGAYRLQMRNDGAYFSYVVGPQSWKRFLFPPRQTLFTVSRKDGSFAISSAAEPPPLYAFIGVRPCDLKAIMIQDRVFLGGPFQAPDYKARRQQVFVLAVNCTEPGGDCFCASVDAGPRAGPGFDLALTELDDVFIVEVGSEVGRQVMRQVRWRPAGAFELQSARRALAEAEQRMGRKMDTSDLPNLLYQNLEHRRWEDVSQRCLSCGNCTQVCPTCFCTDVQDVPDLTGQTTNRVRVWDSCFSLEFSHVHGGNIRPHTRARYRQWLTHKLGSWIDQFGTLGCVGCGRCITWCPVGIDITAELAAIREEA